MKASLEYNFVESSLPDLTVDDTDTSNASDTEKKGLSGTTVILIAAGSALLVAVLVGFGVFMWLKRQKGHSEIPKINPPPQAPAMGQENAGILPGNESPGSKVTSQPMSTTEFSNVGPAAAFPYSKTPVDPRLHGRTSIYSDTSIMNSAYPQGSGVGYHHEQYYGQQQPIYVPVYVPQSMPAQGSYIAESYPGFNQMPAPSNYIMMKQEVPENYAVPSHELYQNYAVPYHEMHQSYAVPSQEASAHIQDDTPNIALKK